MLFLGLILSLTAVVWGASANAIWLPAPDETTEFSLRDIESSSRRSIYNNHYRYGK